MLLDLVQSFLRATMSLEHDELSTNWYFLLQTLLPVRFVFFTGPSTIVPSLHRLGVCIFKLFTPLASFPYATWSSAIFLASYSQHWICGNFNWLLVLSVVWFGFFTGPSTIAPSLHRPRVCIFKLFIPLASFSYATWTSTTFLASYSEPWTFGNFNILRIFITIITACTTWVIHWSVHDCTFIA